MITAVIADDESLAREKIKRLLNSYPNISVIAECSDGSQTLQTVIEMKPALLFLDIKMPLASGIDVVKSFPVGGKTLVVLTTAYDDFAVEAFELQAFDYLLKPFDKKRFALTMERVQAKIASAAIPDYTELWSLVQSIGSKKEQPYIERLVVREKNSLIPVMIGEIEYIESEGNYLNIYNAVTHKTLLYRETLSAIEDKLDPAVFLRISRSALIRISSIAEMQSAFNAEYSITMKSGKKLKTGRTYKDKIEKLF